MTDKPQRRPRKEGPVKTRYIVGTLRCQRCANDWFVSNLNEHHRRVFCPVCGEQNDINEAIKRAA